MKRGLVVLIISIILGGFVIYTEVFVNDTLSQMILSINNIKMSSKIAEDINNENIVMLTDKLESFWNRREKIICLSYNHKDLEKIGEQVVKVSTYAKQNKKQEFEYELKVLLFYVEGYKDVITTNFQNLL